MFKLFSAALMASVVAGSASAEVSDYVRTETKNYLNHSGCSLVTYVKSSGASLGRVWILKFDMTKGYRFRAFHGDGNGVRSTVATMADSLSKMGETPICGMNGDYFYADSTTVPNSFACTVSASKLMYPGVENFGIEKSFSGSTGSMKRFFIETADGEFHHAEMGKTAYMTGVKPAHSYDLTYDGKKVRNAIHTCLFNYPVKDGKLGDMGHYQARSNYPRSQIGLGTNEVGNTMIAFCVNDGRQLTWSNSVTDEETAQMLINEGCREVGEFDGGGSAQLWVNGCEPAKSAYPNYINKPSDGSPRKVANGVFILAPRNDVATTAKIGDYEYETLDEAMFAVAPGEAISLVAESNWATADEIPTSCTITSADAAVNSINCTKAPKIAAGVKVQLSNVSFKGNRVLEVADGGVVSVSGTVALERIECVDANGFEVAGAIDGDIFVTCAGADAAGLVFGHSSLSPAELASSLPHLRNATYPMLFAKAVAGSSGGSDLVWDSEVGFGEVTETFVGGYRGMVVNAVISERTAGIGDGLYLKLTLRDANGAVVDTVVGGPCANAKCSVTTANVLTPGYYYRYELAFADEGGNVYPGLPVFAKHVLAAGKEDWFSANAATGEEVSGKWVTKPTVVGGNYQLNDGVEYSFVADSKTNGVVNVKSTVSISGGYVDREIREIAGDLVKSTPQSAVIVKECEDESLVWMGLVYEGGVPKFRELYGVVPSSNHLYSVVQEVDGNQAVSRVSYLVGVDGSEPIRLADAEGNVWFAGATASEMGVVNVSGHRSMMAKLDGVRCSTDAPANEVSPGGGPLPVQAASADEAEKSVVVVAEVPAAAQGVVPPAVYKTYFKAKAYESGVSGTYNVFCEMNEEVVEPEKTLKELAEKLGSLAGGTLEVTGKAGLYYSVFETGTLKDGEKSFTEGERAMADGENKVKIPMTKFEDAGFYRLNISTIPGGVQ